MPDGRRYEYYRAWRASQEWLNVLGAEGWRLVAVESEFFYFVREISDA